MGKNNDRILILIIVITVLWESEAGLCDPRVLCCVLFLFFLFFFLPKEVFAMELCSYRLK